MPLEPLRLDRVVTRIGSGAGCDLDLEMPEITGCWIEVVGFDAARLDFSQLTTTGTLSVAAVPEPETYALMLAGLGVVGWVARRRQCRAV